MNFVEKIKDSVEAFGLPFIYGTAEELNLLTDNTAMPAAMCYTIQDSQGVMVGTQVCERASVTMFFIDSTSFALESIENEKIIDECKLRADRWLDSIRNGSVFTISDIVRYRRIYLQFYGPYTGIGVNVVLRENIGSIFCE